MSKRKACFVVALISFVVLVVMVAYRLPPTYYGFMMHSQRYYAQIATACDYLIETTPHSATNTVGQWPPGITALRGDAKSLPPAVRHLHANKVLVETNGVIIAIGVSRLGYSIVWERSPYDDTGKRWELATVAENLRRVVYSRNKAEGANQ